MLWFNKFFKKKEEISQPSIPEIISKITIPPEIIQMLPGHEEELSELQKIHNSKKILQRLDELVTIDEAGIERISYDIDNLIRSETQIKLGIKTTETNSWKERALLLKLERILIHRKNLQQRIEIYNQNIRVYMNMIARIQDIGAMKMEGIDEEKIEAIWLDFKEQAESYKEKIMANEISTKDTTSIMTVNLEDRLQELRNEIKSESQSKDSIETKLKTDIITPSQDSQPLQLE